MEALGFQPANEVQAMFADPGAQGDGFPLLLELLKGLTSSSVSVQCEALVQFPRLFDLFPFPITINTAAVRLSDVFMAKTTSNFIRYQVLRVFAQSERHLGAVYSIDDVMRRVTSVIYSNDPVARAITLRMWGCMASIIAEQKRIHHHVLKCLGSSDQVEIEAAVYATARICKKSKTFARSIAKKTFDMIMKLETPTSVKLRLIPVFRHMHHSPDTIAEARQVCLNLLESYRTRSFVLPLLSTLTTLASHSLVDIPQQVSLLCDYIEDDPRQTVQVHALCNLTTLARRAPHMCDPHTIEVLLHVLQDSPNSSVQLGALEVLLALSTTPTAAHLLTVQKRNADNDGMDLDSTGVENGGENGDGGIDPRVWAVWEQLVKSRADDVGVATAQVMTNTLIALHPNGDACSGDTQQRAAVLISVLTKRATAFANESSDSAHPRFKKVLRCLLKLLPAFKIYALAVCKEMVVAMPGCRGTETGSTLCRWLDVVEARLPGAVSSLQETPPTVKEMLGDGPLLAKSPKYLVSLGRLVFRLGDESLLAHLEGCVLAVAMGGGEVLVNDDTCSGWTAFSIARHAAHLGHYDFAAKTFQALSDMVASEHYYFWLHALELLSRAEASFAQIRSEEEGESRLWAALTAANGTYPDAVASLKAGSKAGYDFSFQRRFLSVRISTLEAYSSLCFLLAAMKGCDPVSVLAARAEAVASRFVDVAGEYEALQLAFFDIDPPSADILKAQELACRTMADATLVVLRIGDAKVGWAGRKMTPTCGYEAVGNSQVLIDTCQLIASRLETLRAEPLAAREAQVEHLSKIAAEVLLVPMSLPPYYFQAKTSLEIKLSTKPAPDKDGTMKTPNGTRLVIKIEGVVQVTSGSESDRAKVLGRIRSVGIAMGVVVDSASSGPKKRILSVPDVALGADEKLGQATGWQAFGPPAPVSRRAGATRRAQTTDKKDSGTTTHQQVRLTDGYFTATFVTDPQPSAYTATFTVSILDRSDLLWVTGPSTSVRVLPPDA